MHLSHFIFWSSFMSTQEQNSVPCLPLQPLPAAPAQQPNRRVLVVAAVVALAALAAGGRMWYRSHYYVETENAYVAGHVHPVSTRIAGVVTKVLIDDNQLVKEGDVIAELDPFDQGVKVEQIQAQIASAQQQVRRLTRRSRKCRPRPAPPPRKWRSRKRNWCAPSRTPSVSASCITAR
jgi:hypothetical protein